MKYKKRILLWAIIGLTFFTAACAEEQEGDADISSKPSPTITVVPSETTPGVSGTATPTPTVEQQFDAFTEQLFLDEIVLNTINLHYTLAYPENFGITEYEPGLGSFAIEEMRKSYDEMKQLKKELESFSYEQLTKEQQFTYDIILDYIETELSVEDLLLYTEVLGPVTGYQAQLPVLLAEYKFRTVRDIEDYLALVSKVDDIFTELVEFEKEKSKAGLFMSDYVAESIIDQCRQFIENPEENYMIAVFETEINAFEGLSEEEKKNYIAKNKELITTELVTAYQTLIDGLQSLKGTGTNEKGLYYYEDGVRYYEYLVRSLTGSSRSVKELMDATDKYIYNSIMRMQNVMIKNPNVMNDWDTYEFCETDPEKILKDLAVKIQKDFPALPETNYVIKYVHPSMEEHMSPAFYLTPPVDDSLNNIIYINKSQITQDLYTTMAHEGYPGHLYQNVYTASKNLPLVRNLFSNSGYSEGWATYVEYYSYSLGGLDEDLAQVLMLNNSAILGIYAYVDMGVHYLGWDVEDVREYLVYYGLNGDAAQEIFEIMVSEPANYLSYFIGYLEILNLQETAKTAWGNDYSLKKFHEAVLSLGAAPFDLLDEAIKNYN
ncbi:MAG: DUF885 domain-containing protein [Lachnospiraceae bacterium]|nr:DUF885 domain-containing protein [Lachnospiraceae bacterium]